MTNAEIPPERELDPAGLRLAGWNQGRDPGRTPMQWSGERLAGFSPPDTEDTWLPVAHSYRSLNVASQLEESDSLLALYAALLRTRKEHPALQVGDYQPLNDAPRGAYCYRREYQEKRVLVCLNFSKQDLTVPASHSQGGRVLLSTYLDRQGPVERNLVLRPLEGCILTL